jgi:hypothetical protein
VIRHSSRNATDGDLPKLGCSTMTQVSDSAEFCHRTGFQDAGGNFSVKVAKRNPRNCNWIISSGASTTSSL